MKNKNLLLILLVVVLGSTLAYLYYQQKANEITSERFNIPDVSQIGSIIINDKYGNNTTLNKRDKTWYVDDSIPAEKRKMTIILTALNKLNVEYPVSEKMRKKVIDDLRKHAIKVTINDNDGDEIKTIHLANAIHGRGNNMILSHDGVVSNQPYIVKIVGTDKNVKHIFQAEPRMWYTTQVFGVKPDHIKEVKVTYFNRPNKSFTMTKDDELIKITPSHDSLEIKKGLDKFKVVNFLLEFESMHFETRVNSDSIIKKIQGKKPFIKIACTNVWDETQEITMYKKEGKKELKNRGVTGEYMPTEIDKYWAYIPELKQYAITQHYVFGPVMMDYDYFFEK